MVCTSLRLLCAYAPRTQAIDPGIDAALAAGVDDAEAGGVEAAAFIGPGAEADAARDDGMPQRPFGVVVRGRQQRLGDEGDHRLPIVEDFARKSTHLLLDRVLVALAVPLDAGQQALDSGVVVAVPDPLD